DAKRAIAELRFEVPLPEVGRFENVAVGIDRAGVREPLGRVQRFRHGSTVRSRRSYSHRSVGSVASHMGGVWFVGATRWRRQWQTWLLLALIAGLIGGAVLGALAGARRSTSAYERLLRVSRSPHEVLFVTDQQVVLEIEDWLRSSSLVDRFAPAVGV